MGETQDMIHLKETFSSCEPVKPGDLCASKVQWWERHRIDIPVPKGRNQKEEKGASVQNLSRQATRDLKVPEQSSLALYPTLYTHWGGGLTFWTYWDDSPTSMALLCGDFAPQMSPSGALSLRCHRMALPSIQRPSDLLKQRKWLHPLKPMRQPWWSVNHLQSYSSLFKKNGAYSQLNCCMIHSCRI